MTNQQKALFLIIFASLIGGGNNVVNKIGLLDIPPLGFVATRMIISLVVLMPAMIHVKLWRVKHTLKLILFSLLATSNITFFILGLAKTTAAAAASLYAAVPLLTAGLSYVLYREKLTPRQLGGIFLGLFGSLIIIITPVLHQNQLQTGSLTGNLIITLAVFSYAIHTALSKKIQQTHSSFTIIQFFIITATLVLAPLALAEANRTGVWLAQINLRSAGALLYVALLGTIAFYFLYQEAVRHATPLIASLTLYLGPIFGVVLAVIVLNETLAVEFLAGAALIFIGIWLVTGKSRQSLEKTRKKW